MFFDNVQSQSNSQNTNLSNNISLGSTGTDFGTFTPVNETKPEFKSSNDLGLSAALGDGATSGSVGMSRGETTRETGSTFKPSYDGFSPGVNDNIDKYIMYGSMAVTIIVSIFAFLKLKGK